MVTLGHQFPHRDIMTTLRSILLLFICAMAAVAVVVCLYLMADDMKTPQQNFIRRFPPRITFRKEIFDLGVNSYYFCGSTSSRVYLGNYTLPSLVL